jgi:hypothetical protein
MGAMAAAWLVTILFSMSPTCSMARSMAASFAAWVSTSHWSSTRFSVEVHFFFGASGKPRCLSTFDGRVLRVEVGTGVVVDI